jgi:pilus assembly protein CpaF
MDQRLFALNEKIEDLYTQLANQEAGFESQDLSEKVKVELDQFSHQNADLATRAQAEYQGWGPLQILIDNPSVCEIIILSHQHIWFEDRSGLKPSTDYFLTERTYRDFIYRTCAKLDTQLTLETPFCQGQIEQLRIQMIGAQSKGGAVSMNIRKLHSTQWPLTQLAEQNWCSADEQKTLSRWMLEKRNILIVGATGTGKTTVLSSLLTEISENERCVIIEDTSEIPSPNLCSQKLLARKDTQNILPEITMSHLVAHSLRMRPDRLVVGEVRGPEAKDLLMALSTGHRGSLATLHADDPWQALIRMEMLIQLGAPQWQTQAIRKLIQLSLDGILVVEKTKQGLRRLKSLHQIVGLDEGQFILEQVQ